MSKSFRKPPSRAAADASRPLPTIPPALCFTAPLAVRLSEWRQKKEMSVGGCGSGRRSSLPHSFNALPAF
jgi:hypothetical protein